MSERVIRSVSLRAGARTFTLVENRRRELALWLIGTGALVASWFALREATDMPTQGLIFIGIVGGLLELLISWRLLPWNVRLSVDVDERICRIAWRFFFLPIQRRQYALDGRVLAWGQGIHTISKQVDAKDSGVSATGCVLGLLLGPVLAFLLAPRATETIAVHERREGIVLRRGPGADELLVAVKDRGSVEDALALIGQLAGGGQRVVA